MKTLEEEKTKKVLEAGTEDLSLEFKPSFDYKKNDWLREVVIRGILAMSNTRDGGDIIIGVEENKNTFDLKGMESPHLIEWTQNMDDFKSQVESFATSPVSYEIYEGHLENRSFVIIRVTEFRTHPIICRKNGVSKKGNGFVLEEGAIYIRTLKDKPSSVKLVNPIDVHDLIERASDKTIARFHQRGWKHVSEGTDKSSAQFGKERADF